MLPSSIANYFAYVSLGNVKYFRQLNLRISSLGVKISDLPNAFGSKLSHSISLFFGHINHVVGMCPEKQMVRIYASRVVAFMEDMKFFGRLFKMNLPGNSMGVLSPVVDVKLSISSGRLCASPFPARMKRDNFDFIPEVLDGIG